MLIPTSLGPLGRNVDDCALYMETICGPDIWESDVYVPPVPFSKAEYQAKDKLKIAFFATDGWFEPCPTSKRAVHETMQRLSEAGHICERIDPPTNGFEHTRM